MMEEERNGFGLFDGLCPEFPVGALDAMWCTAAPLELPILGGLLLLLVAGTAFLVHRHREARRAIPYVMPFSPSIGAPAGRRPAHAGTLYTEDRSESGGDDEGPEPPHGAVAARDGRVSAGAAGGAEPASSPDSTQFMTFSSTAGDGEPVAIRVPAARSSTPSSATAHVDPLDPGVSGSRDSVAGQLALDHTLQLLPGRLEIEQGAGSGGEIRFVRVPGPRQEITLGRAEGPPHRHIRLDSQTVSRQHARLIFRDGTWILRNESSTNPTVHNGRQLDSVTEGAVLRDGDRIDLGDMTFTFRQDTARDRLASRSSWYTDRGRRAVNQDAAMIRTLPDGRELAVVCDGMGSHAAGGVASHLALDALVQALAGGASLGDAVREANHAVYASATADPEREGMGTTLVAAIRQGDSIEIANVGDSRAYRVDAHGARQLTHDHSFVAEMVQKGRMSHEDAVRSPWRNAVTRCLGLEDEVDVDLFHEEGTDGNFLLVLCSDGIHGVLSTEEIEKMAREAGDVRDLARTLGERALVRGGEDNVAAAVMAFGDIVSLTGAGA